MITQAKIAKQLNVSNALISMLVSTRRRPSWKRAKQLAEITGTEPVLWLEGTTEQIKAALEEGPKPQPQ